MKKYALIYAAFMLVIFASTSCKHDDDDNQPQVDTEAPVIDLVLPTEGATFANGDTMHIHAMVTDNESVHEVQVTLTRTNDNSELLNMEAHIHGATGHVDTFYVINVPQHSDLLLKVEASDHNENEAEVKRPYHIMM